MIWIIGKKKFVVSYFLIILYVHVFSMPTWAQYLRPCFYKINLLQILNFLNLLDMFYVQMWFMGEYSHISVEFGDVSLISSFIVLLSKSFTHSDTCVLELLFAEFWFISYFLVATVIYYSLLTIQKVLVALCFFLAIHTSNKIVH